MAISFRGPGRVRPGLPVFPPARGREIRPSDRPRTIDAAAKNPVSSTVIDSTSSLPNHKGIQASWAVCYSKSSARGRPAACELGFTRCFSAHLLFGGRLPRGKVDPEGDGCTSKGRLRGPTSARQNNNSLVDSHSTPHDSVSRFAQERPIKLFVPLCHSLFIAFARFRLEGQSESAWAPGPGRLHSALLGSQRDYGSNL